MQSRIPSHATKVFAGERSDVYQWPQKLFDGREVTFEVVKRKPSAGVLAVLPDRSFLLCEQEQPGRPPFIGLFGGMVDPGESGLQAAQRELLEETGYSSADWHPWISQSSFGSVEWQLEYFIARGCTQTGQQKLDGGEKIRLFTVRSISELLDICVRPEFRDQTVALWLLKQAHLDPSLQMLEQSLLADVSE